MNEKRLVRRQDDRVFLGVAGGLGNYFGIDPVIIRLAFVLLTLANGYGLLLYFIMVFLMPQVDISVGKAHVFDEEEIVIKDS